jgi:hypothetical protein
MDDITKLTAGIKQFLETNKAAIESSADMISIKVFNNRNSFINQLATAQLAVTSVLNSINAALDCARANRDKDLEIVSHLCKKTWTDVAKKRPRPPDNASGTSIQANRVKITDSIFISAITVSSFDHVKQDGELYYVTPCEHFAVKICGKLFHGNIGKIYTDEKTPEKIKDCKFTNTCEHHGKCDWYHDPMKHPDSKDRRNFISGSFMYIGPDQDLPRRARARRVGSRDYLDTDIIGMGVDERDRFYDQTMHDILCSLIIHQQYT